MRHASLHAPVRRRTTRDPSQRAGFGSVLWRAAQQARADAIATTAQALAYSLFLAIPAIMLVALGVFAQLSDPAGVGRLVGALDGIVPAPAAALLRDSLERSTASPHGATALGAIGLVLALWTVTSAAGTLMKGVTAAFGIPEERGFLRRRLVALLIIACLLVAAVLVVGLLVLGPLIQGWVGAAIGQPGITAWVWWTAQWPVLLAALVFLFGTVIALGSGSGLRVRELAPGALTATIIWLAASAAFALYASRFGSYEKTWGTLSAVVVTLVWLWLTSLALLFGAEVDGEIARRRRRSG